MKNSPSDVTQKVVGDMARNLAKMAKANPDTSSAPDDDVLKKVTEAELRAATDPEFAQQQEARRLALTRMQAERERLQSAGASREEIDKLKEEQRAKLEQDYKALQEGYKTMEEENKSLKESLQAQSMRQMVREELQGLGLKGGGSSGGVRSKLDEALDKYMADRIDGLIGGGNQPQVTAEEVRKMIAQGIEDGNKKQSTPQQIVDSIIGLITAGDEAKKKLGMGQGDGRYLAQTAGGGMRSDVLKILLEDERERLRMQYEHESQTERNKHLGTLAGSVRDNMEDMIGASRDMVKEHRESSKGKQEGQPQSEPEEGYQIKCSLCNEVLIYPEKPASIFDCPKCHGKLRLQEAPQGPPLPQRSGAQGSGPGLEF